MANYEWVVQLVVPHLKQNARGFIIFGTKLKKKMLSNFSPVTLLDDRFLPVDKVRNLGVILFCQLGEATAYFDSIGNLFKMK